MSMPLAVHQVIIRPLVTEKISNIEGLYGFIVHKDANKIQIRKAVETLFDVKVAFVNTLNSKPLLKAFGRKKGVVKAYKKAYVRLIDSAIDFNTL